MKPNDLFDLDGARFRHNRTGVEYTVDDVRELRHDAAEATLIDDGGRSFVVPLAALDKLYSRIEIDDTEPAGILPIGSVGIDYDGPTPPPALGSSTDELSFKRSGRPRVERPPVESYFGEPRKLGPRRREEQ